jgi:hypothetical protein
VNHSCSRWIRSITSKGIGNSVPDLRSKLSLGRGLGLTNFSDVKIMVTDMIS